MRGKCHSFACGGVGKSDFVGVEKESLCLFAAVECVAKYRIAEPVLVGAVNTELVSATSLGIKINSWEFGINHFVLCYCWFAVFVVHHLTRTVIKVGTERKTYLSSLEYSLLLSGRLGGGHLLLQHRYIALLYGVLRELFLKIMVGVKGLGNHHDAARCLVKTVDYQRTVAVGVPLPHDVIDGHLACLSGHRQHPRRLYYNSKLRILKDRTHNLLYPGRGRERGLGWGWVDHPPHQRHATSFARGIEV